MSEHLILPHPEPGVYWVKQKWVGEVLCGGIVAEGALPTGPIPPQWELMEYYPVDFPFRPYKNRWARIGWDTLLEHSKIAEIGPRVLPPEEKTMKTKTLKERLASIDPATLEAGIETDALVAECLGWTTLEGKAVHEFQAEGRKGGPPWDAIWPDSIDDRFENGEPRWHNKRIWVKDGKQVACEECGTLPGWSSDPDLAFSVLWPWLEENCVSVRICGGQVPNNFRIIEVLGPLAKITYWNGIETFDSFALELCRVVVAVAKGETNESSQIS